MHSIIIPHRDYNRYLRHCLRLIEGSAETCGIGDYEVVIVDQGSAEPPVKRFAGHDRVIHQPRSEYFNKPRAQNAGIEAARGDVLSFLDADTLVAPRWMENVAALDRLGRQALTKLCYRVRYVPAPALDVLEATLSIWFAEYEALPIAFEGYGEARTDRTETEARQPVFGNSQFSIKRTVLGGLRFNEEFQGRGYEDLWMNREIWRHFGDGYRAAIVTDPDHALLHIRNPYPSTPEATELWGPGKQNGANSQRYDST